VETVPRARLPRQHATPATGWRRGEENKHITKSSDRFIKK
jgi:hypothetical protein